MLALLAALAVWSGAQTTSGAQTAYGAKGLFPVYETANQWLIFDKNPAAGKEKLKLGSNFLVIGSAGAELFHVARASGTYGGACRNKKPAKLRAALLKGPRSKVGSPILGISVPDTFTMKGSRARYKALQNEVTEATYQKLGEAIKTAGGASVMKIDFGARLEVAGLVEPFFLVEGSQVGGEFKRCLRLADGDKLIGDCVPMPHALMAETALLQFVSYDPSGSGNPYLLAYTPEEPLWGHERWGFIVRKDGARPFLSDAMDRRCREGF